MTITYNDLKSYLSKKNLVYDIGNKDQLIPKSSSKQVKNIILNFKDATMEDFKDFVYEKDGRNLLIKNGEQTVTVLDYFSNDLGTATKSKVKFIRCSDSDSDISIIDSGLIWTTGLEFAPKKGVVTGSMFSDEINLSGIQKAYGKKNKGYKIKAGSGNDVITGSQFNDTISGGAGVNVVNYDFGEKSGIDTITLVKGEKLKLNITDKTVPVALDDLVLVKIGKHLVITKPDSSENEIVLKNYFAMISKAEVRIGDELISSYISNEGEINILGTGKIKGTEYNDNIVGSTRKDTIYSYTGTDEIYAGAGKDKIILGKGNKVLYIDDNDGNDTVTLSDTNEVNIKYQDGSSETLKFVKNEKTGNLSIYRENGQYTLIKAFFKKDTVLKINDIVYDKADIVNDLTIVASTGEKYTSMKNDNESLTLGDGNDYVDVTGNNAVITLSNEFDGNKNIAFADNVNARLIFEDKKYKDFYTKESEVLYTAGDPLIMKNGNDIEVGADVTLKNMEGKTCSVVIEDMEGKTKTIMTGAGTINGTYESEIIVGSNSDDVINSNGNNDLIFMGDGNDVLNVTSVEKGDASNNNTAGMIGIGGKEPLSNDLAYPAISVYDSAGNDTYNTSFDSGLYIEDSAGSDTLNIQYTGNNLMYFFDVVNPNFADQNPVVYTDLMICDKTDFKNAISPMLKRVAMAVFTGASVDVKAELEGLQGSYGYAWIDDHFGNSQTIETINIVDSNNEVTKTIDYDYESEGSDLNAVYQSVANWLSGKSYTTTWDVLENGGMADMAALLNLYTSN